MDGKSVDKSARIDKITVGVFYGEYMIRSMIITLAEFIYN